MGYKNEATNLRDAWAKGDMENAIAQVPERMAEEIVLVGAPDQCRKRVDEYREAGVKLPLIQAFYSPGDLDSNVRPCLETFAG